MRPGRTAKKKSMAIPRGLQKLPHPGGGAGIFGRRYAGAAASADAAAYVDGSYDHGQKKFSFGAVLLYNKEERQFYEAFSDPELASMRNVAGEIKGAEFIMRYCAEHGIPGIDIYYDYAGIEKWCTGEWKASKAGTQRYAALYKELSKTVAIRFVKVKGHSGDKYNDLADKLAKKALGIE